MIGYDESKKDFRLRIKIILVVSLFLCFLLVGKLYILQIHDSSKYSIMSDKNRIRLSPILPKRGRIFSSDGKVIACNRHKYKLVIEASHKDIFSKNIDILSSTMDLTDKDKEELMNVRKKIPLYAPIVMKDDLSWDEYSKISMILYQLSNVSLESTFLRDYMMPLEFSHVLGYTAKSNDGMQILVGKTGVEFCMNEDLIGKIGGLQSEINALGKKMRTIDIAHPVSGKDVTLTINSEIQKYAYDLIIEKQAGACVVLDITSNEVIALVSVPGFDINLLSSKITKKQWEEIINDPLKPLINRAVGCTYPPGSIFKIITAFAALSENVISENDKIFCAGHVRLDNGTFHCWNRHGHGYVNIYDALRMSCDCYFFEVALKLGIDNIVKYAQKFGFGELTGIELPNESPGLLPTKKWKILRYGNTWKPYETIITGIGQGALLATLLQTATMMGKLYTEDFNFSPTLIKNKKNEDSKKINPVNKNIAGIVKNALYQVCNSSGGTAIWSCLTEYGISGKTGSSQVRKIKSHEAGKSQSSFDWKYRDHAFFAGCAPYRKPKYVVAVLIEHGGGGASVAAPIARKIFDKLISTNSLQNNMAPSS